MAIRDLHGKTAVITGAASGIGRSTALLFAREGANVVAFDLDEPGLAALRQAVEALGVRCRTARLDVTDEAAVRQAARQVEEEFGAPHLLVNNAGIGFIGAFLDGDLSHWKRVLGVNVMGVVHCCHAFLPAMIAAGDARHVLNLSSSAGNFPIASMAAYGASKAAVSGFSEVLRMELSSTRLRVTTVCPGVIDTPIVHAKQSVGPSVSGEQIAALRAYYRRVGCSPDLVADAMLRAVRSDRNLVLVGPSARLVYHLKRVSQALVRRLMLRFARDSGYLAAVAPSPSPKRRPGVLP